MKFNSIHVSILLATLLFCRSVAFTQAAEYFGGDQRTGVDIMWFKFLKDSKETKTSILFFSRNRASVDYRNSPTTFGSTNAVSYNFKSGLGIVGVASFLNNGFTPKLGIQLFKQKNDFMFFGWLVADLKNHGNMDLFGMFRYQPKLSNNFKLFTQLELYPVYNPSEEYWSLTQRLRLGIKYDKFTFGLMADFNQQGVSHFSTTENIGGFLRHEF
ncbi:MAG: hypothetical protein ACOVO1_03185 [Chitinophagaceae bacterium]